MASTTTTTDGKTIPEPESGTRGSPRQAATTAASHFHVDFALRLLLFATALTALLVLVTAKQTELVPNPLTLRFVSRTAKFNHSPALIYLVTALAVTCFYSVVTLVASAFAISKPSPSAKLLFLLALYDALMAGVLASATGAGGAVAYIGAKGNSHVRWNKICNVYDNFCRHIGSSVGVSVAASALLVALVVLSTHSLYRRCR